MIIIRELFLFLLMFFICVFTFNKLTCSLIGLPSQIGQIAYNWIRQKRPPLFRSLLCFRALVLVDLVSSHFVNCNPIKVICGYLYKFCVISKSCSRISFCLEKGLVSQLIFRDDIIFASMCLQSVDSLLPCDLTEHVAFLNFSFMKFHRASIFRLSTYALNAICLHYLVSFVLKLYNWTFSMFFNSIHLPCC